MAEEGVGFLRPSLRHCWDESWLTILMRVTRAVGGEDEVETWLRGVARLRPIAGSRSGQQLCRIAAARDDLEFVESCPPARIVFAEAQNLGPKSWV